MSDKETLLQLAERIYDLDEMVYTTLQSALGRVYNGEREQCIHDILRLMEYRDRGHMLRSELALIANMARTIPDPDKRHEIMQIYERVLHDTLNLPNSFGEGDVLDPQISELNLLQRFSPEDHLIICISKSYGAGGNEVGFSLANRLHINYYDSEIFENVLKRLEAEEDSVKDYGGYEQPMDATEHSRIIYEKPELKRAKKATAKDWMRQLNRYHGLSKQDAVFFNQSQLMVDMAKKEDFVIMDRCAEVILSNNRIPHISVFISAPFERRVSRLANIHKAMSEKQVRQMLRRMDREHRAYYKFYTSRQWDDPRNYDMCLNSASYGIQGSADLLYDLISKNLPQWDPAANKPSEKK